MIISVLLIFVYIECYSVATQYQIPKNELFGTVEQVFFNVFVTLPDAIAMVMALSKVEQVFFNVFVTLPDAIAPATALSKVEQVFFNVFVTLPDAIATATALK